MRALLPPELRGFQSRIRSGLVQLYYGDPGVHFEAWFHWRTSRLELGLHFERSARENAVLFSRFDRHIVELKHELGESVELEQWEKGWARIYETWPCDRLDRPFQDRMTERLARIIQVLQPVLEDLEARR